MNTIVLRRPYRPVRVAGLDPLASALFAAPGWSAPAVPQVELRAEGEDGVLTVEAPGLDPAADLSVQLTGSVLTVAGVRRSVTGNRRSAVRFSRSVQLPETLAADAVSATYTAGVLRVRVAGMFPAPVVPETVSVAITGDVPSAVETTPAPAELATGTAASETTAASEDGDAATDAA